MKKTFISKMVFAANNAMWGREANSITITMNLSGGTMQLNASYKRNINN